MRIRTIEKLSENRETTPEGYLLCKGAALARTGAMPYLAEEVAPELMEGSSSDTALLLREEKDVFDPAAMASFEGKPLTIEHPDEDVDPENWSELAKGMVINIRRGLGNEGDLLLGDILVTDAEAIELITDGKCELSLLDTYFWHCRDLGVETSQYLSEELFFSQSSQPPIL